MKLKILLLYIFIHISSLQVSGQEFLSTHGKAIVNESGDTILLRGMGLGGWMLQEGYMIPGVVYPSDFDMGVLNSAYYDNEVANYHVSTGSYTAWNNGWVYRNDRVDLEKTTDNVNTNGYSLGWLGTDE